jgi:hypothetical protein
MRSPLIFICLALSTGCAVEADVAPVENVESTREAVYQGAIDASGTLSIPGNVSNATSAMICNEGRGTLTAWSGTLSASTNNKVEYKFDLVKDGTVIATQTQTLAPCAGASCQIPMVDFPLRAPLSGKYAVNVRARAKNIIINLDYTGTSQVIQITTQSGCSGVPVPPGGVGANQWFRYRHAVSGAHFYTSDWSELYDGYDGWVFESVQSKMPSVPSAGMVPFYRSRAPNGDHFYSRDVNEGPRAGHTAEGITGYVYATPQPGAVPLYRYMGPNFHFYTTDWNELGAGRSGYTYEGIAAYTIPWSTTKSCTNACPSGGTYDGANCLYMYSPGPNPFVYNGAFYYTRVPGAVPCPSGGTFDGANCWLNKWPPPGTEAFAWNNAFYLKPACPAW